MTFHTNDLNTSNDRIAHLINAKQAPIHLCKSHMNFNVKTVINPPTCKFSNSETKLELWQFAVEMMKYLFLVTNLQLPIRNMCTFKASNRSMAIFMLILITGVCIGPTDAITKHSTNTKTKKATADADNHRQVPRSAQQLSSTATSISSPSYLYSPKSLKSTSVTRSLPLPITSSDILAQYTLPNGSYFTHMTFDRKSSVVYAGASNRIIQLNYSLSVLSQAITGPKADNPQCHGVCPEDTETLETINHNKILVVNEAGSTLITCGSVMQGSCYIYPTEKFPNSPQFIDIPLAANDETASTLAFIGPSRYTAWTKEDVLYVGETFTNVGDYRHEVPAISSRHLDNLHFAEYSFQQTILNIDVNHRDHFLVDYKYGFNTSDYAYFVIVQKKSHLVEEAGFITRIARVCVSDTNYDSYTEITLQCKKRLSTNENDIDATEINYNILRDAKVTPAGQRLAQQMGVKRDDLVLVAAFSPSKEITNEPQSKSAVCLFSLKDIDEAFTENIHMCFNGTVKDRNMGYISGAINEGKCPVVGSTGNVYNFCNVGLKISGVSPIVSYSLFDFEHESITSVTSAITGPHTLAFLGTANGWIKKVLISGPDPGEYENVEIDPSNAILPDTMMSPKMDYLYVLSKHKITKLRVEHCSIYTNCSSCLESRDPFCGWCSLEKRCTIRNACHKDASNQRWLSLGTGHQCIDFEMVQPNRIPINQMTSVQLVIRILPELPPNAKYKCVFGNSTPIDANVIENGLSCQTPPVNNRPIIPAQSDHVLVPLSVRSSETNKDFVSRSFAFFDCSRHDTCRQCVQSEWNCNWCLYDNRCVHNSTSCRNTGSVISQSTSCPHYKPSVNNEPILLANQVPKEIRLEIENLPRPQSAHTGFLCIVNIEGAHMSLPARVESKKFIVCEKTTYSYEALTNEYEARVDILWNRNHYIDTVPIILYKCDVLGSHREHADCSLCVTRAAKYQCTWCGNTCMYNETCNPGLAVNECPRPRIDMIKPLSGPMEGGTLITIEGSNLGIRKEDVRDNIRIGNIPCELVNYEISVKIECRTGPAGYEMVAPIKVGNEAGFTESSVKFNYKDIQLDGLLPQRGPQSGGTKLSIIGKWLNIGSSITAFLDNYECAVNGSQASSSQITCTTSAARHPQEIRELTLIIDGANRTYTCRNAPPTASDSESDFELKGYNGYSDLIGCSIFNYTTDPKVMQIKPLKSFSSGGRMITVHGTNLDSIQKPELEVFLNDELVNKTICTVITPNQMECPSPAVTGKFQAYRREIEQQQLQVTGAIPTASVDKLQQAKAERKKRQTSYAESLYTTIGYYTTAAASTPWSTPLLSSSIYVDAIGATSPTALASTSSEDINDLSTSNDIAASLKVHETQLSLQVSFVMDNVQAVRDLDKHFQNLRSTIIYVDDPVYFPFPNNMKLYKGDTLVIEGEKLNIASDESDVSVTIGQKQCNVTSLALTQLVCTPTDQQPDATDELGIETSTYLPLVVVHVGKTLRFPIGSLKYDLEKPYTFSHAMVGIAIGCAIIVCLLFVILIVYRRKSTQAEREYKRIQIQMDTLESNVRMECKQAFAELQTDIGLTADLENSGIPTLDHISYIMKVFFPGVSDHPILNSPKLRIQTSRTNYDMAMIQFEQLINNKVFLLTFIDTLEAQKSFNIRDKVNVASLLMIVLMNKMDYATDILKCLLLRLIDKSVMTKHPQLMLRRTESVVEKMLTNYMAICMYDYLKEFAGSSLFLLFKAIKHQIEKGLVDAVTHEARYSLSEEKLLREQIAHNSVTLHIVQEDLDEKIQCKVLDCDTISQVKSKILDHLFKNTPFSMRPSIHEVDLEWRHGRGGHLTLQDEDLTTKSIGGQWKRLNTLAHYGVKESAVMSLIVRQNNTEMYNNSYNAKQHQPNHGYYINNSQSHIIMNNDLDGRLQSPTVSGVRYFHLVKPMMFSTNIDDHHLNIKNMAMSIGVLGSQGMQMLGSAGAINDRSANKTIPEIFLTRLLATKGTIQKFVDDFFQTILTVNEDLPPTVKWLFDLLDEAAHRHGIVDMEIIHAWKSNSLPLRFWVNFIKNPDFIFDINKTTTVDACLSVIAQTFMDSCSTTEHRLGKDSPSNKLLFAKDIPQYREMVKQFYRDVAHLPQISDHAIGNIMHQLSINDEFDTIAALKELYIYVTKYRDQILDALNNDPNCIKSHLAHKLQNVACTLEGEETSAC